MKIESNRILPVVGISPGFITLLVTEDFLAISLRANSSDVITLHCIHKNENFIYESFEFDCVNLVFK